MEGHVETAAVGDGDHALRRPLCISCHHAAHANTQNHLHLQRALLRKRREDRKSNGKGNGNDSDTLSCHTFM